MKTKFIALSLLTFFTFGCGGGGEKAAPSSSQSEEQSQSAQPTPEKETTPSQKKEPVMSLSYDMTSVEPEFVNAYIDASASMKGYFSKNSDGRFITAISNSGVDKLFWLDKKYTEIKGIPTNQLLTGEFKGGDSQFHEMLENVITHDNLGIRVVRDPEGNIFLDATGKKSGRGAYLCPDPSCFKKARKSKRLEGNLNSVIPEEIYERLEAEILSVNQ